MANIETIITENIDVWTSALRRRATQGRGSSSRIELYGVQKLRELILDLAVRGLLVPQDPEDEPASALLESIELEKKQLIKEGKIRKQKKLAKVEKSELGITLPFGWESIRVGDVGRIFNGNSINARVKEDKYTGIQGLPYIATKDVGYGFESFDYENGVAIPLGEASFRVAPKGSVLICAEGGSAGKKCGIANQDICFGNKLYANHLFSNIEPKYILSVYLSPTFYKSFAESMTGIIGGISRAKFILLPLALPPLEEQKRIVKKVDKLMTLCDQLEEQQESSISAHQQLVEVLLNALAQAADQEGFDQTWLRIFANFETLFTTESSVEQLKQTILQLAVMGKLVLQDSGDESAKILLNKIIATNNNLIKYKKTPANINKSEEVFKIPDNWLWVRVHDLISANRDISYGIIKLGKEPDEGVLTLRCSDIKTGFIDSSNIRKVKVEIEAAYKRTRLQGGEVLINIRGTLGGVALVPKEMAGYNIAREVAMLAFDSNIDARYMVNLIASPYFWKMILSNLKGIAYKGLNLNMLRNFPIPLPPLAEQKRIVKKVEDLFAICDQLKTQLRTAQETKLKLADAITSQAVE